MADVTPDTSPLANAAKWFADRTEQLTGNLPSVPSGELWLFAENTFDNPVRISTVGPPDNTVVSLSGRGDIQDKATLVAFNLPIGLVVTLIDSIPSDSTVLPAGCGRTATLVGTGNVVAINLITLNMNDAVSGWYKRPVDLLQGGFVLTETAGKSGQRQYVFLSDWSESDVHSMDNWYINDGADEVWFQLTPGQYLTLFEHPQGTGRAFREASGDQPGWGLSLISSGFRDVASAFAWSGVRPVREEIQNVSIKANVDGNVEPVMSTAVCVNRTSTPQSFEVSAATTNSQSVTAEDVSTHGGGGTVALTTTSTVSAEVPGVGSAETSVELSVSAYYDFTKSSSLGEERSVEQALTVTETVTAAPKSTTTAKLEVRVGRLRKTQQTVDVKRWYKKPVAGGVLEAGSNLWVRDEKTSIVINGGVELGSKLDISEEPLTSSGRSTQVPARVSAGAYGG